MAELKRANRIAVKTVDGDLVAVFHKTHTLLGEVSLAQAQEQGYEVTADANKALQRELFRKWIIDNAEGFGYNYDPTNRQVNAPKANYTTDEVLVDDVLNYSLEQMQELTNKYNTASKIADKLEWKGINKDEIIITPMTTTANGADLSKMGIENGRYAKSGNWAWADIKVIVDLGFRNTDIHVEVMMQLVSGQLKKSDIGIQKFTDMVKQEIIENGLATAEELNPPKEKKSKKKAENTKEEDIKSEEIKEEPKLEVQEEKTPDKPKRQRKSKKKAEEK